jgi:signal transduction histidine kinase
VKEKKRGVGPASAAHLSRGRGSLGRTLLIAFLLLTLVPLVGMSAVTLWRQYRNSRAQIINQLTSVATLKEAEVKIWFNSLSPHLELVIADPRTRSDITELIDGEHNEILLAGWRSLLLDTLGIALVAGSEFDELFLMDTHGTVIVATNPSREGGTFQVQPFFKQGLNAPYVQSPFYSLLHDKMVVFAAVPVRDESGMTRGVLAGVTNLDTLNDIMLERAGLGQNGETYLVNSDYIMLTEPRSTQSGEFPAVRTVGADQALSGVNGAELYENYEYPAVPVVGVYRWIPELNVALLAEQSQAEAFAATFQHIRITLATTVIAALITAGAAILVTRRIALPLAHLTSIAAQAAGGDLTQTAPVERDDEIGTLASAFNTMTLRLRDLITGLERRVADRTRELETLNAVAGVVSRSLDLEEILHDALDKALQVLEIEAGGIFLLDVREPQSNDVLEPSTSASSVEPSHAADDTSAATGILTIAVQRGFSPEFIEAIDGLEVGEGFSGLVAQSGQPLVVRDVSTDPRLTRMVAREEGFHSLAVVPLHSKEKTLGTLFAGTRGYREFTDQDVQLLTSIGQQLGVAIENARQRAQIEATLRQSEMEKAVAAERNRLARDLHDSVTQSLFAVTLYADAAAQLVSSGQMDLVAGNVRKLRRTAKEALGEMRLLVFELRPPLLKQEGLVAALQARLESVEGRAGLETLLKVEGKGRLAPDVEQGLYRITQEALNNIFKHAQARNITVSLRLAEHPQTTILEIADDGIGFDPSAVQGRGGLGLRGMAERVEQLGGQLRIKSEPGAGTIVQVEVHQ